MRTRIVALACALELCATSVQAGSTKFTSKWAAPDARALNFQGQRVVAMVISKEESLRRGTEAMLAQQLNERGVQGIPAYSLVPTDELRDKDRARALIEGAGAVGIVSMRVVTREQEAAASVPGYWGGTYYGSFWGGYYGWGWGAIYDPGYISFDRIYSVETLIYDLRQDKLVWASMTQSKNPDTAEEIIKKVISMITDQMRKAGLIKKQ
jgi:hypothetical protein